jgi:parallel beta-helix repeat protein
MHAFPRQRRLACLSNRDRWKVSFIRTAAVLLSFLASSLVAARAELVSGEITQDRVLSGTNNVQGTVIVRPGVTLTIAPGATMLMKAAAAFEVRGKLIAEGTAGTPILFTREVAGQRWNRFTFINSNGNRLKHCTFEYADCAGSHLDYYDTDCNPGTTPPARSYHEAIVLLASQADFVSCIFRNLPDGGSTAEGDALAVISDDPTHPGSSSAYFDGCQFLSIGQGIHSRFSFVLVENCFFTGHRGDNDDIDMYGESTPPPLIRRNVFLNPAHDDMINPTRCSAIIIGNVLSGGDDHGIVLRDAGRPIVMNNLIYNVAAAGISVQNECDALLVNNTIVNSARGVRFFDHDARWGPPYCLTPGSGRATLINCIIWNCTNSLTLADSPDPSDRGSQAAVYSCNIQGGQASATVSANSTLLWGAGNINVDPQFVTGTFRPGAASPMIDAGINPTTIAAELATALAFAVDPDGIPRPLDSNGDGTARYDLGAYEFLLVTADSNGDTIPDGWLHGHGLNPIDPGVAIGNPDGDAFTTLHEWIADTDPTDPGSQLRIVSFNFGPPFTLRFQSSAGRRYTLSATVDLTPPASWAPVPGQIRIPGTGGLDTLTDNNASTPNKFYRLNVELP